jgi:DNA polymerase III subunit gamma/tau
MSYLVLARKYRPMTFEDLVGQQHVCQTLGNAIKTGRIHHAFLFTGARGVGKTSAARIFAKALNCEAGLSAQPCNRCQSCLEITAGQGLDVFEIDGASNTGVDDIRDLRDNIRYLPSRSRFKIFIIDEVHMLSINAFNALLKTLEEPPEHAKFIFATTEPHKIPVTILSRCQRFDFRKIALPLIRERLQQIAAAEHIVISERSLTLVARRGEGSMRDALSTFDQVIAFCGEDIRDEDVQGLLGMVDRRLLLDTVEGVLGRDGRRVLDAVQRIDDLGYSFRQFCRELVEVFRSLVILGVVDEPAELLDATDEELAALRQLANLAGLEDLQRAVTVLVRTEGDLAGSSFPRLALEMALVRLAHLPPGREVAALVRQFEDLERRLASASPPVAASRGRAVADVPREKSAPAPSVPELPVSDTQTEPGSQAAGLPGDWQNLVLQVKKERPRIGSLLEHGRVMKLELPCLELGFEENSFHLVQMQDGELQEAFRALAEKFFGQPVAFKVSVLPVAEAESAPLSLAAQRQARREDRTRELHAEALSHPGVKAARSLFEVENVEVRPLDAGSQGEPAGE